MRTRWIVVVIGATVLVAGALVLVRPRLQNYAVEQSCANNLIAAAFAVRLYAEDSGGKFPMNFFSIRNQLGSARILYCPADRARTERGMFSEADDYSYELIAPGVSLTNGPLVRCRIHQFEGYADGRVWTGKTWRTKK